MELNLRHFLTLLAIFLLAVWLMLGFPRLAFATDWKKTVVYTPATTHVVKYDDGTTKTEPMTGDNWTVFMEQNCAPPNTQLALYKVPNAPAGEHQETLTSKTQCACWQAATVEMWQNVAYPSAPTPRTPQVCTPAQSSCHAAMDP